MFYLYIFSNKIYFSYFQKRVKKLETRLREQRDRHLRPRLNQFASQAFIRNAMFDVNAPSKNNIDTADSEMVRFFLLD